MCLWESGPGQPPSVCKYDGDIMLVVEHSMEHVSSITVNGYYRPICADSSRGMEEQSKTADIHNVILYVQLIQI